MLAAMVSFAISFIYSFIDCCQ